jgi:hypothetical protein
MTLENLKAAVELHRPIEHDKWGNETSDPAAADPKHGIRCRECRVNVTSSGCLTWRTANGEGPR